MDVGRDRAIALWNRRASPAAQEAVAWIGQPDIERLHETGYAAVSSTGDEQKGDVPLYLAPPPSHASLLRDASTLRDEMARIAVAVGRSNKDGLDVDWFQLAADVRDLAAERDAIRAATIEEIVALVDDFSWTLPLFENHEVNAVTDDAAESVREQILVAIRALPSPPTGEA